MGATVLVGMVVAPGITFLLLGLVWLLGWTPGERLVARLTAAVYGSMAAAAAWLGWLMVSTGTSAVHSPRRAWFQVAAYRFDLWIFIDGLSLPLVALTTALIGIVGAFSVRYLHRERGFFRFFALLHLFAFGAMVAFTAASFDLLLAGWELVGITSVLLIAFFDERREPVRNAIRVFATYRIADLGLLLAIFFMHTLARTADAPEMFLGNWPNQTTKLGTAAATLIGLLLLFAAAGKSAQVPFTGWLPRAMEGPTPSSAIFYGAISVHLGAYLLLRAQPMLSAAPLAAIAVVVVGVATALLGTLSHRVSTDAKASLAFASMAQLGIVFAEIGLGHPRLAVAHMLGHAVVRTLQFLRAPSMLHDYHRVHAASGGDLGQTGSHYEHLVPEWARAWLYRVGLERGFYDAIVDRLVVGPVVRFANWCASFEPGRPRGSDR